MKRILVNGAGGFIAGHLVKRLKSEGFWVRGVDIKQPRVCRIRCRRVYSRRPARTERCARVVEGIDEVYQLAADMGGAGTSSPASTMPR